MRRTGQDFPDSHAFRESPAGVRRQQSQGSYHLRAVGAKHMWRFPAESDRTLRISVTRTGIPPLEGNLLIREGTG